MRVYFILVSVSFLIVLIGMLLILVCIYFYNFAIKRSKKSVFDDLMKEDELLTSLFNSLGEHKEWLYQNDPDRITIRSFDDLKLSAKFLMHKKEKTNRIAIVVHGYASCGDDLSQVARLFYSRYGFNVLLPDLRGHGDSDGHYISFGCHDRLDLLSWIEYINNKFSNDTEILLFGVSMGAATVSLVSGESLPKNVKLIVSDCAYSGVIDILSYHLRRRFRLPSFPLLNLTSFICKLKAKFSFHEGNVYAQVSKSKTPMLFVHGSNDQFVPTDMVYKLYDSAKVDKELVIIDGAGHCVSYFKDSRKYEDAIERFIKKYFNNKRLTG
ncbi:alpha/beta hydrolase [Haloplasma contractile]|uniref:Alpha-beta hydrolase protein n=1 Tax=Haloplasma contractile SSD-17B TaxID=1033810 RepID=U2DYU4_9MOLU|nr:alpha/beta hydrolase [Haloplasma contractile]ERJ13412.1 Alpha-beta hydrolase protein [Haloplasma contractile SSD-17B]